MDENKKELLIIKIATSFRIFFIIIFLFGVIVHNELMSLFILFLLYTAESLLEEIIDNKKFLYKEYIITAGITIGFLGLVRLAEVLGK